jgi:hypothetical protein
MKTKFAIGCLVQWYECDIIEEYVDSLKDAIEQYDGQVIVDFTIISNEDLEKCISSKQKEECMKKIINICDFGNVRFIDNLHTIADYRREFNNEYCEQVDVLMWGESDSLIPKQTFTILNNLHSQVKHQTPKYLGFFGCCKMWDDSWKPIEHPDFTDKPFYDSPKQFKPNHWWSLRYTMNKDEMNKINNKTEELDVRILPQHKFNGCGLVISSEVIKAGVNIPKSVFFVHEDTAFMHMTNKVLGNIPQYVIKNILLVHNRKHPKKREYVKDETGNTMQQQRESNQWYLKAHKMSEQNCYNLFNPSYKSYSWQDVWDNQ